ncbi:MAG: hypothetical protein H0W06_03920 [Chloroflexia bacterium]|nr:hypothetical protein [Chloroflexia bacterium]
MATSSADNHCENRSKRGDELAELARYPDVAKLGHAVYTGEGLRLFLTTPSARFDGQTALDLLRGGNEERVLSALASDYEAIS